MIVITPNKVPMVHAFLMTLPPDLDRERLGAELDRARTSFDIVRRRGAGIEDRLRAIANVLPDVSNEEKRQPLVSERMELASEQAAWPLDSTVAARRYATALVMWSTYVYPQVVYAQRRAAEEADLIAGQILPLRNKLTRWEQSSGELDAHREEHAAMLRELRTLSAKRAPCEARAHEARNVASDLLNRLRDQFGSDFQTPGTVTAAHIERFASRMLKVA